MRIWPRLVAFSQDMTNVRFMCCHLLTPPSWGRKVNKVLNPLYFGKNLEIIGKK